MGNACLGVWRDTKCYKKRAKRRLITTRVKPFGQHDSCSINTFRMVESPKVELLISVMLIRRSASFCLLPNACQADAIGYSSRRQ